VSTFSLYVVVRTFVQSQIWPKITLGDLKSSSADKAHQELPSCSPWIWYLSFAHVWRRHQQRILSAHLSEDSSLPVQSVLRHARRPLLYQRKPPNSCQSVTETRHSLDSCTELQITVLLPTFRLPAWGKTAASVLKTRMSWSQGL
jgi:hypothetical protein